MESVQQQVHILHSQGQHEDNTVDQLIEADSTQPDESSVNTSSPSDSFQSSSNVSLPLIQNSHTSNYSNGSESESLNGSTDAYITRSIAEITISNNSQANQVQNVGNTTYEIMIIRWVEDHMLEQLHMMADGYQGLSDWEQ